MKVYVLVISNIEVDNEPFLFLKREEAVDYAEKMINDFAHLFGYNNYLRDEALENFEWHEAVRLGSLEIVLYEREINE